MKRTILVITGLFFIVSLPNMAVRAQTEKKACKIDLQAINANPQAVQPIIARSGDRITESASDNTVRSIEPLTPAGRAGSVSVANYKEVSVNRLHQWLSDEDIFLVNVHIPYAGEIPQTDAKIPYNNISEFLYQFPAEVDARIVLYCRSGHMSEIAAKKLAAFGYINVYDLQGGMNAWKAAGFKILEN